VSIVCCLIVVASFAMFVVDQTSHASNHQKNEVTGTGEAPAGQRPSSVTSEGSETGTKPAEQGTVHRFIDEASEKLTSPFSGLTSGSHSQWVVEIVETLLALLLYGVLLRFLVARMLHLRG